MAHSSPTMNVVSVKFPNYLGAYLGDQDSSPPQNSECQENMKLQMNIKGRKESIPSLHPTPSIQHSIDVKASSKSLKMGSRKSLQSVMNTQIYNRNTHISHSEDRDQGNSSIRSLGLSNQKIASQENSMGGSLYLLVDAIELLEGQQHHRTIGIGIQEEVSVQVLPKNMVKRIKYALSKPSLQNHQCLVEDPGLEPVKILPFNKVSEPGDVQHSFNSISKVCEIGQGTTSRTRSKRGRLQAFPSKYSDSVLQPWKKVSRKVPTCHCS
jgi:hypothetical protein